MQLQVSAVSMYQNYLLILHPWHLCRAEWLAAVAQGLIVVL